MRHYTFDSAAVRLSGSSAAREFFEPVFIDRNRELLIVALCDADIRLIEILSIPGEEALVAISLPKIMRGAIRAECVAVIVAHNHPSGDVRPSKQDLLITRRLSQAAEVLEITLLDHIIFGIGPAFSFREKGYL